MVILHLRKFPEIILRDLYWQEIGVQYLEPRPSVAEDG